MILSGAMRPPLDPRRLAHGGVIDTLISRRGDP